MRGLLLVALIVVVIIGVIHTVRNNQGETILDQKRNVVGETLDMLLQTKIVRIREALNTYFMDHGAFPEYMDLLVPDYIRTQQEISDPWNMPLKLEQDESMSTAIHSAGPDGQWETSDDIWRKI